MPSHMMASCNLVMAMARSRLLSGKPFRRWSTASMSRRSSLSSLIGLYGTSMGFDCGGLLGCIGCFGCFSWQDLLGKFLNGVQYLRVTTGFPKLQGRLGGRKVVLQIGVDWIAAGVRGFQNLNHKL